MGVHWWEVALIALAGLWAGLINAVVGSGTLVTFPVLVALGYPPVTATTSNAIGLITGSITGAVGYRSELAGQGRRLVGYAVASFLGAIGGTVLLLSLPADAFETIVPVLVGLSVVLVLVQPVLSRRLKTRAAVDRSSSPLLYKVAWIGGCVLYDVAKLRAAGGFEFWRELPSSHCGEDVLAQLRVMATHGGCGVLPTGAYHQQLPTTVPDRTTDAPYLLPVP